MKLTIKDGRDHFYTFDTNRILLLTATDEDMIKQVEFSTEENGEEVSWTSEVLTGSDGVKYVQVPNEFLNGDYTRLVCYYVALDSNGEYTRQKEIFRIRARQEPQDYFLTYSERVTFASIKALTEQYKATTKQYMDTTEGFKDNAGRSAELASKYAENNEDVAVEPGKYSAKHWSIKAEAAKETAVQKATEAGTSEVNSKTYMESAQSAKQDAETAKNDANTILEQVQSKGTEITNFVATSKTEIETQKNESVNAVKSVYQTDLNELKGDLSELDDTVNRVIYRKNIANPVLFTPNKFMNESGEIVSNNSYFYTGKIKVTSGEILNFTRSRFVTAFKNGIVSSTDSISGNNLYAYTVPPDITEVVITSYTNEIANFIVTYSDEVETYQPSYIPYENLYITEEMTQKIKYNILHGKKIYNFGDSIAAGDGNNGIGYAELLSEYGAIVTDYAVGGSTLTRVEGQTMESILTHIENASSELPDLILLEGGSNDYSQSRALGTMTQYRYFEVTQWEFDETKYLEALEKAFYMLNQKYPGVPVIWVFSHQQSSRDKKDVDGVQLSYYTMHDKSLEVCKKWAKPICDVFTEGNMNTCINYHKANYTNNSDGTHPNELGYRKFYIPLLKATIEKVIN